MKKTEKIKKIKAISHSAILCKNCNHVIFSRAHHDFRKCKCGETFVDGGFEYLRCGYKNDKSYAVILIKFPLNITEKLLYNDWNLQKNKYGCYNLQEKCPKFISNGLKIYLKKMQKKLDKE